MIKKILKSAQITTSFSPTFFLRSKFCSFKAPPPRKVYRSDEFEITGFVGKGSTSRVYYGHNILTKEQVILKLFKQTIPDEKIFKQIYVNQIIAECGYVVPMLSAIKEQGTGGWGIVFKNLHGVPLNERGIVDFATGLKFCKDILRALQFCHKNGVVHRDLKKSNILITNTGAKLFDFGLSKIQKLQDFSVRRFGTKCYYTPQMIFRVPHFTRKIDIWVCGVIMLQILSQIKTLMPYHSDEVSQRQIVEVSGFDEDICKDRTLRYVNRVNFKEKLKGKCKDESVAAELANIIRRMTDIQPMQRPQAAEILQQKVFKDIE